MRTTGAPCVAVAWAAAVLLGWPTALPAQAWNDQAALALARRAIARRSRAAADTALRDYKAQAHGFRSEEHTSELQSRPHLVCRLLLEKKKKSAIAMHQKVFW